MSASARGACEQCRAAKVKCDRQYPSCGRCVQRSLTCAGVLSTNGYLFRNENDVARRNSRRARGETGGFTTVPVDFSMVEQSPMQGLSSTEQQPLTIEEQAESDVHALCPWLTRRTCKLIPTPLKRDVAARAIERFFVNWILHPGRNGTPGHMANLPVLYYSADADSALAHAVRTVAFADVRTSYDAEGMPLNSMARRSYGKALARIRETTQLEGELTSDQAFAAVLLIDSFETVYLASEIPLGQHGEAIKYLLRLRGTEQLFSRSNFSLWSLANHRLQARQILRHEEPDAVQIELLDLLDTERPDIRICADTMRMTALCAAAKRLIERPEPLLASSAEQAYSLSQIAGQMQTLITDIEDWTSRMSQAWQPTLVDARMMTRRPREYQYSHDHPLAHLYCAKLIAYPDVWLAFLWGFHTACQIILRETFIAVLELQVKVRGCGPRQAQADAIDRERGMVESLAAKIIGAFPALMGFTNSAGEEGDCLPQGLMAGRCLALFALEVIHKAKYPRFEHKDSAIAVIRWMSASYVLD